MVGGRIGCGKYGGGCIWMWLVAGSRIGGCGLHWVVVVVVSSACVGCTYWWLRVALGGFRLQWVALVIVASNVRCFHW